jgi:hypothetical protein
MFILCECKTWTLALSVEYKTKVIENRAPVFTACRAKKDAYRSTGRPTSELEDTCTNLLVLYLKTLIGRMLVGNELGSM